MVQSEGGDRACRALCRSNAEEDRIRTNKDNDKQTLFALEPVWPSNETRCFPVLKSHCCIFLSVKPMPHNIRLQGLNVHALNIIGMPHRSRRVSCAQDWARNRDMCASKSTCKLNSPSRLCFLLRWSNSRCSRISKSDGFNPNPTTTANAEWSLPS